MDIIFSFSFFHLLFLLLLFSIFWYLVCGCYSLTLCFCYCFIFLSCFCIIFQFHCLKLLKNRHGFFPSPRSLIFGIHFNNLLLYFRYGNRWNEHKHFCKKWSAFELVNLVEELCCNFWLIHC